MRGPQRNPDGVTEIVGAALQFVGQRKIRLFLKIYFKRKVVANRHSKLY